tara:strand:+ start:4376 stop:5971 length:1596 start_codon:yes stop_codon:yes gene_type:complete
MTVLTGETGAGKSILLDALGLILGDRADTNIIRGGAEKTDITAIFSIKDNVAVNKKLNIMEINSNNNELFLRRTIKKDGRSRAYINDTPVPIQTLRDIGGCLIEIHGQHAHQSLSQPKSQRELLDQFGQYESTLTDTINAYHKLIDIDDQIKKLNTNSDDFESTLTLLKYQIEELNKLAIEESEYTKLSEEFKRQSNSQHIVETCHEILNELSESDINTNTRLSKCQNKINELYLLDNSLNNVSTLIDSAIIQINEATTELKNYLNEFDADTSQLGSLENRLDKLNELARKYKKRPEELPDHLNLLIKQLNELEDSFKKREELELKQKEITTKYFNLAIELRNKRIKTAEVFSRKITNKIHELGMAGKLQIEVEAINNKTPRQFGMDDITFMVSTNPGQPLRPIAKVASGGELSRLSLAIQIISSKDNNIPTMIFDEVDAGIGGRVAEIVGKLLNTLAAHSQIFCVTHLPQVASYGHQHYQVTKNMKEGETYTEVRSLEEKERINEISRMLAGMEVTTESRANAEKMLALK